MALIKHRPPAGKVFHSEVDGKIIHFTTLQVVFLIGTDTSDRLDAAYQLTSSHTIFKPKLANQRAYWKASWYSHDGDWALSADHLISLP
jgi:hypothetical protein